MDPALFEQAVEFIDSGLRQLGPGSNANLISVDDKLQLYALYKQATVGPCTGPRPYFYDIQGRYKYDAWRQLGDMPKDVAISRYVEQVIELGQKLMLLLEGEGKIHSGIDNLKLALLRLLKNSEELRRRSPIEYVNPRKPGDEREASRLEELDSRIRTSSSVDMDGGEEDPLHVKEPREDGSQESCLRSHLAVGELTESAVCNLIKRLEYLETNLISLKDELHILKSETHERRSRLNKALSLISLAAAGSCSLYIIYKFYLRSHGKVKGC